MTISYTGDICSTHSWSFLRVIFRWRGSIWKSVLTELSIWLILYYSVMFVFKVLLNEQGKKTFLFMAQYTGVTADYIPLTFMLGFFVKIVVDRWKDMFANIGFIDSVAHAVTTIIRGDDPETARARRNIMRYLCLIQVLVLRDISVKVRKQFPDMQSVVEAGLIQPHELKLMESIGVRVQQQQKEQAKMDQFGTHWIPHNWVTQLCYRLRKRDKIASDPLLSHLLRELTNYRERLQNLINFDLVPIPLAYPQVVFMSVRTYFLICLFSRQNILFDSSKTTNDKDNELHPLAFELFVPVMTILQFIFYMGWTKVAEALLNPLGEDDDDFETLFVIERNITVGDGLKYVQILYWVPDQLDVPVDLSNSFRKKARTVINALIGSAIRAVPPTEKEDGEEGDDQMRRRGTRRKRMKSNGERSPGDQQKKDRTIEETHQILHKIGSEGDAQKQNLYP